ncbi:hypothetical protein AJ80_08635 [Polytolypa hystricis UAMH7299]|uniref:F-box domain-containing protein n=1 Tax=Polytolypa hystricis (strain UAMH7299) TaxID=1447883 RepID=A0A2B7X489_POLH7|nr:hypothetical protein AJ80_08635 [Polytolypa hystricis UAMH7299]
MALFGMAPDLPDLGLFSRLPLEVRQMIWSEFVPFGQDTNRDLRVQKADLRILRTSRDLHDEISRFIYLGSCLEFSVSPIYDPQDHWTTVSFSRGAPGNRTNATWIFKSRANTRSRGFDHLPFHKVDHIIVNLFAPNPNFGKKLHNLRLKVDFLVDLLGRGSHIEDLTVHLAKRDGQDWVEKPGGPANQTIKLLPSSYSPFDYEVVVVPLFSLRNLGNINVSTHCAELEEAMDWAILDWALGAAQLGVGTYEFDFMTARFFALARQYAVSNTAYAVSQRALGLPSPEPDDYDSGYGSGSVSDEDSDGGLDAESDMDWGHGI